MGINVGDCGDEDMDMDLMLDEDGMLDEDEDSYEDHILEEDENIEEDSLGLRDDEIGDVWEDIASGPEDRDVDIVRGEIVIPDSQDDPEFEDGIISDRLQLTMRATIQYLQEYSRGTNLLNLDLEERHLCLSYWHLLGRVDVDWIMQQLMKAIPREVQNLFE